MGKKIWLPYGMALIALWIGTFYDYQIDAYLYDPRNPIGNLFEGYILWFFIALLAFSFALLQRVQQQWWYLIPEAITAIYAVYEVGKYSFAIQDHIVLVGLLGIGLMALCTTIVYRLPLAYLKKWKYKVIFFISVFLSAIALAAIMKYLWGRVRFREMDSMTQFTQWFLPQGNSGHHSFPSGHTVTFSTLLCLEVIMKDGEKQQTPRYLSFLIYGAIVCMAVSRMIMGAHFLSDVTVGFMITYSVFIGYRRYFYRKRYL